MSTSSSSYFESATNPDKPDQYFYSINIVYVFNKGLENNIMYHTNTQKALSKIYCMSLKQKLYLYIQYIRLGDWLNQLFQLTIYFIFEINEPS